jgi:transposase
MEDCDGIKEWKFDLYQQSHDRYLSWRPQELHLRDRFRRRDYPRGNDPDGTGELGRLLPAYTDKSRGHRVGMHSQWANHVLIECGHEVIVANPSKVKLIFGSDKKNDRIDARSLAQLARVDRKLLFLVVHRSEHAH